MVKKGITGMKVEFTMESYKSAPDRSIYHYYCAKENCPQR